MAEADDKAISTGDEVISQELLDLSTSEAFSISEVDTLLCVRPVTVVTLVGDAHSGKSTLICSIYDRFLHDVFADRMSCGIQTLVALEKRAHYERLDSGMQTPDTARTPLSEGLQYFHFAFTSLTEPYHREDIVISDRAGELYNRARGNPELVADLEEFPKADIVCILMDGGRLADLEERAGAMQIVRQTLRMLTDTKAVNLNSVVQIVTTKQDLLQQAGDWATLDGRLDVFRKKLNEDFGPRLKSLDFFTVAARDPTGGLDRAFGVDVLLRSWYGQLKSRNLPSISELIAVTEFDKLADRFQTWEHRDA